MNFVGEENESDGAIAKWLCTGLQIRSQRFDSASRLHLFSGGKKIEAVPRAGVAQLVERNLAKVEVASSRLVSRSTKLLQITNIGFGRCVLSDAGVAQLVERNLAKVEVASSRLVSRSNFFFFPFANSKFRSFGRLFVRVVFRKSVRGGATTGKRRFSPAEIASGLRYNRTIEFFRKNAVYSGRRAAE